MESSGDRRSELLDTFSSIVSSDTIALDEAFLVFAAVLDGEFDVVEHLVRLDELASEVQSPTVEGIARHLFDGSRAFSGNADSYYDPLNSLLNRVLERKIGIPITMSVLLIEVARRLGVRLTGVGMPGHFLVGSDVAVGHVPDFFIDPFHGGRVLDLEGCRDLFTTVAGRAAFDKRFLAALHPIAILDRALNNLKAIYVGTQDMHKLQSLMSLRSRLPGLGRVERDEFLRMMAPLN